MQFSVCVCECMTKAHTHPVHSGVWVRHKHLPRDGRTDWSFDDITPHWQLLRRWWGCLKSRSVQIKRIRRRPWSSLCGWQKKLPGLRESKSRMEFPSKGFWEMLTLYFEVDSGWFTRSNLFNNVSSSFFNRPRREKREGTKCGGFSSFNNIKLLEPRKVLFFSCGS